MDKGCFRVYINDMSNSYINGRISGMIAAFSDDDDRVFANKVSRKRPDVLIMRVETREENWIKMKELIEKQYPGLCDFVCEA